MNNIINEILEDYKKGETSLEQANAALKAAGADFTLDPEKNPSGGWTDAEIEAGFRPGDPVADVQRSPDLDRRQELAGLRVVQRTAGGMYRVAYDADGYAVKAVRV